MTSPFGAAKDDVAFELYCGYDLPTGDGNDLLGVWVYRFADCINACESFNNPARDHTNATCYGVSYHLDDLNEGMGNCWLKAFQHISKVANVNVSSAVIATN